MLRFVINLDRSKERLKETSNRLEQLDIEFERMPAVDGSVLTDDEIQSWTYPLDHFATKVRFTRNITRGEVGCFLSHRKCWRRLVESDQLWAMCMEDDIVVSDLAAKYMKTDDWLPSSIDVCQLSCLESCQKGRIGQKIIYIDDLMRLVQPLYPMPLGTQCYLISKRAAKRALELSERLPAPVDNFLFSLWFDLANEFQVWRTDPVLVTQNQNIASAIGSRSKKSVQKAPFWIRYGLTRFLLDRRIKKQQKMGQPFEFKFH